jgi:hypothetical protein
MLLEANLVTRLPYFALFAFKVDILRSTNLEMSQLRQIPIWRRLLVRTFVEHTTFSCTGLGWTEETGKRFISMLPNAALCEYPHSPKESLVNSAHFQSCIALDLNIVSLPFQQSFVECRLASSTPYAAKNCNTKSGRIYCQRALNRI